MQVSIGRVNPRKAARQQPRHLVYHVETRADGFYVVMPCGGDLGPYKRIREAAVVCGRLNQRGVTL